MLSIISHGKSDQYIKVTNEAVTSAGFVHINSALARFRVMAVFQVLWVQNSVTMVH